MKTKVRHIMVVAAAATTLGLASPLHADSSVNTGKIVQELTSVPRPELAPKAANMVLTTQGDQREATTAAVVGAAVDLSPDATLTIVSSVAKLSPDMAPAAAVAAAARQPKQTRAIAKATASAAPSQSLKILQAMCKQQPQAFNAIATGVAEAVPKMDRSIINAVVESVPTLKPFYLRAAESLAKENGDAVVGVYMDQISRDLALSAKTLKISEQSLVLAGVSPAQQTILPAPPAPPTPVVRPAFQPLPGTPSEINRNQTVEIPPGGTRYSSP